MVISGGAGDPKYIAGTVDPSAAAGIAAPEGSIYSRFGAGAGQFWLKTGAVDTAWEQMQPAGTIREMLSEKWVRNNIAASLTADPIEGLLSTNFDDLKMIRAGSIVGMSTRLSAAAAGAGITSTAAVNGAAGTLNVVDAIASTGGEATQAAGIDTFVAGDLISVEITTPVGWTATTADIEVLLEVEL